MPAPLPLNDWLAHCAARGLRIGLHERLLANLLMQRLKAQHALPDSLRSRLRLLAPVLCRNPDDQHIYATLVDGWLGATRPASQRGSARGSDAGGVPGGGARRSPPGGRWMISAVALLLAVLGILAMNQAGRFRPGESAPGAPPAAASVAASVAASAAPAAASAAALAASRREIIEPRASVVAASAPAATDPSAVYTPSHPIPSAEPQLPEWLSPLRWTVGLLALASALFTAWRLWRWHRRRLFAEAGALPEDSITQHVLRDPQARPLQPRPRVQHSITRQLRQRMVSDVLKLDARATVRASVQRGGALTLRFAPRTQMPEYLALVERSGERDHQSQYHESLVLALQQRGVAVELYFFRHDPGQGCWRLGRAQLGQDLRLPGPVVALKTLLERHSRHRLLVFGNTTAALQQPQGTPAAWTQAVRQISHRAWFTPLPLADWGPTEHWVTSAQGLDFLLLPMEEAALQTWADWLSAGTTRFQPAARAPTAYPPLLREGADVWAVRTVAPPPAVRAQLQEQLRAYLGDAGMQWLAACALFPLLAWPLTLALGRKLQGATRPPGHPTDPVEDEAALALGVGALAALPWFRQGRLPDWLRTELIESLPETLKAPLRTELHERLSKAVATQGEVVARVARQTLRQQMSRGEGALTDVLLLRFLEPVLAPRLAQRLPDLLKRLFFPHGAVLLGLRPTVAWLAALPMALLLLFLPSVERSLQLEAQAPLSPLTLVLSDATLDAFTVSPEGRSLLLFRAGASRSDPSTATLAAVAAPAASAAQVWTGPPDGSRPLAAAAAADRLAWLIGDGADQHLTRSLQAQVQPPRVVQVRRGLQMAQRATAFAYAPGTRTVFVGTPQGQVLGVPEAQDAQPYLHLSHDQPVQALAVRADGSRGASLAADGRVLLWNAGAQTVPAAAATAKVPAGASSLAFSPDGQRLAVGLADGRVVLVAAQHGAALQELAAEPAHRTAPVLALAFSPDGTRLAGGHAGGALTVWDLERQAPVLRAQTGADVAHLQYSPSGATLWLLDRQGRLQRAGTAPAAQAVVVLGCTDEASTAQQAGATHALTDRLAGALRQDPAAAPVDVLWMPQALWRAWGHGNTPPAGGQVAAPSDAAAQALAARVLAVLRAAPTVPSAPAVSAVSGDTVAGQPSTAAWTQAAASQGLATVTVGTCNVREPAPEGRDRLKQTDWPADPADARLQQQIDAALATLWQPDRGKRPAATQSLLTQPDLLSDLLPRALSRAIGLAEGKDPGSPDSNSRITQVLKLAQAASPVTLQRNAVALYRLIDKARPLSSVARDHADKLEAIMHAAVGQVPQVQIVLGAGAGAQERTAASRLAAAWQRLGMQVAVAPGTDPSVTGTGVRAAGASDRALARWLLQQAFRAQSPKSADAPVVESLAAAGADKDPFRTEDSYRLVLAPTNAAALVFAASSSAGGQQQQQQPPTTAAEPASAPRSLRPGDRFRDCDDDNLCPYLRVLPPGEFLMGTPKTEPGRDSSEDELHKVSIPLRFAMMETEVTRAQYAAYVRLDKRPAPPRCENFLSSDREPVICVTQSDAMAYAKWLSSKTKQTYRLPTEAEWEYAARGRTRTNSAYSFGDDEEQICRFANVSDRALRERAASLDGNQRGGGVNCSDGFQRTAPVGSLISNDYGLFDMHGNVWEWVLDCWHDNYRGAPVDGTEWETVCSSSSKGTVVRGGGWNSWAKDARSGKRSWRSSPGALGDDLGFRLVRTIPPDQ